MPPLVGLIDEVLTKTWFLNETSSRYPNNSKLEFRKNEHIIRPQSTINNHQKTATDTTGLMSHTRYRYKMKTLGFLSIILLIASIANVNAQIKQSPNQQVPNHSVD